MPSTLKFLFVFPVRVLTLLNYSKDTLARKNKTFFITLLMLISMSALLGFSRKWDKECRARNCSSDVSRIFTCLASLISNGKNSYLVIITWCSWTWTWWLLKDAGVQWPLLITYWLNSVNVCGFSFCNLKVTVYSSPKESFQKLWDEMAGRFSLPEKRYIRLPNIVKLWWVLIKAIP